MSIISNLFNNIWSSWYVCIH